MDVLPGAAVAELDGGVAAAHGTIAELPLSGAKP
jgi:hypothetical protein